MTCRFCRLCQKLAQAKDGGVEITPWEKQIAVKNENGQRKFLTLKGERWLFPDKTEEIVRMYTSNTVFVNSLNPYPEYKDIIIGFHAAHLGNKEIFRAPKVLGKLLADADAIIDRDYGSDVGARIMINAGKYASVLKHAHLQIIQVFGARTLIPAVRPRIYERG